MAMAAEIGLAIAVRRATRLCLVITASIASGMPWPRITGATLAIKLISDRPDHRRQHDRPAHVKVRHGPFTQRDVMEQGDVGDQADEADQHPGRPSPGDPDHCRDEAQQEQAAARSSRDHPVNISWHDILTPGP